MRVFPNLSHSAPTAYAFGGAVAALAAGLQWLIRPWVGTHDPFLFFLVALVFAVISLGRGPALIVLLAGIVSGALSAPPLGSLAIRHPHDLAAELLFAAMGLLLVLFGNRLQLTTTRAALAEKRLALAQQNTGVGIFELDFEAGTAFVSPSLCQILARPVMEGAISLERWLGALRPGHVQESRRVMQDHLDRGEFRYEREQRVELPSGEIRWLLNRVELECSAAGRLTQARGVAVDITERKRVDELLRLAQTSLQQQLHDLSRLHAFSQKLVAAGDDLPAALQGLLDIMVELYGTQHGLVSLCNPEDKSLAVIAQAGFDAAAIDELSSIMAGGAGARGPVVPVYPPVDDSDYDSILHSHRALTAQQGLRGVHSMPLMSAKGEVMGAISVMFAEAHEQSERELRLGEVCATTAAAVVDRARARAAASKTETRFTVALQSSAVPFSILTPVRRDDGDIIDFQWTYLNPAAARALGREPAELIGNRIGAILPAAWDAPGLFDRYLTVIERGQPCEFEFPTAATGQGVRWYSVVASPLQGSVAVWFTNVTDRKRHEETLHEANRRKDEFLATLAHELRNPLAPIRQGVRIAGASNSTDAQRLWSYAVIERQVQHMSLLLDDLLDVSRIGRGTLTLRKSRQPLSELIDTALETVRPLIEAKRHHVTTSLPSAPTVLEIDPLRIAQVLGNLLTNAAKYTDPGGELRVSAQFEAEHFVIRVKDNGIGLSLEQQSQVFTMFSQVPAAVERSQGGLGIGLALARGLIELHCGSIEASSAGLGEGTEFTIRLPGSCVVVAADVRHAPVAPAPATRIDRLNRRILIADDNVDAADSLAELLRLEGHEVHVAYDGAEALATFARVDPDAALLDVGMPHVSGLDVARAIRRRPAGRRATLIAVTGWGQERDRQVALDAGFDHHLTKPMMPEDIQHLIVRV
jgi:signal transduction histidine kinase/CheY-like chemotaxis protein